MNLSEIVKKIQTGESDLELSNPEHKALLKVIHGFFRGEKVLYERPYSYYKNEKYLDFYKINSEKSNMKITANFYKKFIKEEVSYAVGNTIAYESDGEEAKDIIKQMIHWNENHDEDLMKYLLIFTKVYELYYINKDNEFCSEIYTPLEAYAYCDKFGNPLIFIHEWTETLDTTKIYIDVYTKKYIYHLDEAFNEISERSKNVFNSIPVSVGTLTKEGLEDSLYNDIKDLQNAFQVNLSDACNEIADFRNAFLAFIGCDVKDEDLKKFNELGAIKIPKATGKEDVKWLIKEINDTFIQNTLDRYIDTMYQISCHINHNEKLQSNLSSLALRSRLIALEEKCSLNINSHKNVVKNRLKILCAYLNKINNKNQYDCKNINIKYTPNIPQDDLMTAQMLAQLPPGTVSRATGRTQLSFIDNPKKEGEKVEEENKKDQDLFKDEYSIQQDTKEDNMEEKTNKSKGELDE